MKDKELFNHIELIWNNLDDGAKKDAFKISQKYINFIGEAKTERIAVQIALELAESRGFIHIDKLDVLKSGDKVYFTNRKKNIILVNIGKIPLNIRSHMITAHIDSPRIDLKANPIYETDDLVLLKTHYYGGIKKYHWVNIPLEMHGVVAKKDGSVIDIHIGDRDDH